MNWSDIEWIYEQLNELVNMLMNQSINELTNDSMKDLMNPWISWLLIDEWINQWMTKQLTETIEDGKCTVWELIFYEFIKQNLAKSRNLEFSVPTMSFRIILWYQ